MSLLTASNPPKTIYSRLDSQWKDDIIFETGKPISYRPDEITKHSRANGSLLATFSTHLHQYGIKSGGKDTTPGTFNEYLTKAVKEHIDINKELGIVDFIEMDGNINWETV
jgi:hypothetical protein